MRRGSRQIPDVRFPPTHQTGQNADQMRGLTLATALVVIALAGCGASGPKPPCMVLSNGNQLCGDAAVSWCELNNVGLDTVDYPLDSSTHQACAAASSWADHGQKVVTVSP